MKSAGGQFFIFGLTGTAVGLAMVLLGLGPDWSAFVWIGPLIGWWAGCGITTVLRKNEQKNSMQNLTEYAQWVANLA